MKIKFFSNYASSTELLKRFKDNYPIVDNVIELTDSDNYEAAVVFNRTYEEIKDTAKIITVIQEPSWSLIHENNKFLTDSDYLIIHDKELFEKTWNIKISGNVIESPSYMWFNDHVHYSSLEGFEYAKKKKKLSIIVSNIYQSIGNYKKRIELLKQILASDLDIDIYGRGLQLEDSRYKGEIEYKVAGLGAYQYSIAIENSNEKNYLTEKFIDCILCGTIPIYNGAPNVDKIYNSQGFKLIDLDSPTIINDIKDIINEIPNKQALINNKDKYFKEYNLYDKLKEIL